MKISHKKQKYIGNVLKILQGFKIKSPEETIDKIINDNCSITRFGDGEFDMILGKGMKYQTYNEQLGRRLEQVLKSNIKAAGCTIQGCTIEQAKEKILRQIKTAL